MTVFDGKVDRNIRYCDPKKSQKQCSPPKFYIHQPHNINCFFSALQSKIMQQTTTQNSYVKVKGLSWLLQKENSAEPSDNQGQILRLEKQEKKWKKHVTNRFQGYNKTVQKFISSQFKRESERQNNYDYDSLRKTQTHFKYVHKHNRSQNQQEKRREYESTIFNLKRKERDIYSQVTKMKLMKGMSEICEKKKNFYDGCVDQYFQNYRKDINKSITRLLNRSSRDSKAKISRS